MTGFPQVIKIQEIKSTLLIFLLLLNFFACLDFVKLSNIQTWIAYSRQIVVYSTHICTHSVLKSGEKMKVGDVTLIPSKAKTRIFI